MKNFKHVQILHMLLVVQESLALKCTCSGGFTSVCCCDCLYELWQVSLTHLLDQFG